MPFGSRFRLTSFVSGIFNKVVTNTSKGKTIPSLTDLTLSLPAPMESEESTATVSNPEVPLLVPENEIAPDPLIQESEFHPPESQVQEGEELMETDNPEFLAPEGEEGAEEHLQDPANPETHFEEGLINEAEYIASTLGGEIVEMVQGDVDEGVGVLVEDPNEIYELHEEQEQDPLASTTVDDIQFEQEEYSEAIHIEEEGSEAVPQQAGHLEDVGVFEIEEDNMDIGIVQEQETVVLPQEETLIDETQIVETVIESSSNGNGEDEDKENGEIAEGDSEPVLEIARRRLSNEGNCYCGKDRNLNIAELLCAACHRWYHESCIGYQLGKLVPFMMNYVFICKNCSPTGLESFKRNQAQFTQMCVTAIANLTQLSVKEGSNRRLFSKDRDIIPHIEMHWEGMTTTTRRVTQSWHSTVTRTLTKESSLFTIQDIPGDPHSPFFGLHDLDLTQIRPNYEAMINSGQLKLAESQNSGQPFRGRGGGKRRTVGGLELPNMSQGSVAKKSRGDTLLAKFVLGHGYPTEHPFNKDGFRYVLAEPDPNAPFRQEFDESSDGAGKAIPSFLHRVLCPSAVLLALHDRAPQLKVSENRLSVTGEKGYCTIRATHGVSKGSWYFEAKIVDMPESSATRIGWGQTQCNVQAPLGFDKFGYSWRSRLGTKFHEAKGKSYCKGGYGLNDVLGFMIVLPEPERRPRSKKSILPDSFKDKPLIRFKSHLYYEEPTDDTKDKPVRKGSKILCFKNGVCCGVAFEDIYEGTYYPSISLYKSCTVKLNFGPNLECPPPQSEYSYKAYNERAEEAIIEQTVADIVFLTEHHGKLRLEQ